MTNRVATRALTAFAAAALTLSVAACSSETEGAAEPASTTTSSAASTSASEPSESPASSSPSDPAPAGSMTASDGSFTWELPNGYTDGTDQMPNTIAAAYDANVANLPTSILVTPMPSDGMTLQEMAEEGASQIESDIGAAVTIVDGFPLSDVDGEDLLAFTTEEYETQGHTVASAGVLTEHDGMVYVFTVNTKAELKSEAADALVELVASVQWA